MKKFNINNHIYIQITDDGWKHLKSTVGYEYIAHCIDREPYKKIVDGEVWYRLQAHSVFDLLPSNLGHKILYETTIMFDDDELIDCE